MNRGKTAYLLCAVLLLCLAPSAHALDYNEAIETHVTVNHGSQAENIIALTFDDGPRSSTPELISTLDSLGIRATFFICGAYADSWVDEFDALCDSGQEIGNHTWSHPVLTRLCENSMIEQLESTSDLIESCSGYRPQLFRPPYGAYNEYVIGAAARLEMATIMWDIDPRDYNDPSPGTIANYIISRASPGSIILLHEGHPNTMAALPIIVNTLREQGYTFVTVGEMLGLYQGIARKERNDMLYPIKPEERGLF